MVSTMLSLYPSVQSKCRKVHNRNMNIHSTREPGPPTSSLTTTLNFFVIRSKILSSTHYFSNETFECQPSHVSPNPRYWHNFQSFAVWALDRRSDRKQTDFEEKIYCLIDINVNTATLRTWDWSYWSAESAAHCSQSPSWCPGSPGWWGPSSCWSPGPAASSAAGHWGGRWSCLTAGNSLQYKS